MLVLNDYVTSQPVAIRADSVLAVVALTTADGSIETRVEYDSDRWRYVLVKESVFEILDAMKALKADA